MGGNDEPMNPKAGQLLGLAMRARKLITGEELTVNAIRSKQAKLVLLAEDASPNTVKKITDKCTTYSVPWLVTADRYALGKAIGKDARVVVAVCDEQFAHKLQHLFTPNS